MGWGLGLGGSQSAQVRQELSVAPHASHASLHFPSPPAAVGGPSRPPGSTITHPSGPYHLLKISPTLFWFIFCSDVCSPHAHLRPPTPKNTNKKENRCELGCRAAQLGLLPQHDGLGCMPGVVEEPSPTAESSLKLTSSFFAATLAAWAGGGCSVKWE